MSKESDRYENVTRIILESCKKSFGYKKVEPKVDHPGKTGTSWEIDATAYLESTGGKILVECRRHTTSKIDQEQVGGLVFRIEDTGAEGGLVVAPLGYQEGARVVAKAKKVTLATLNADATEEDYILKVAEKIFHGVTGKGGPLLGGESPVDVNYGTTSSEGVVSC